MTERVEIKQPPGVRLYIGLFGIVWCGFLVMAVFSTHSADSLVPILMLAVGGTFMYRMFQLAVVADETGVLVRNNFRTRHFRWDEIEDFRIGGPALGMPFGKVIHILLRNDEILTVDVTMRPWLLRRSRAKLAGYLNGLRAWLPPSGGSLMN